MSEEKQLDLDQEVEEITTKLTAKNLKKFTR